MACVKEKKTKTKKKKVKRNRYQNTIFIFIRKSFQAADTTERYHYIYVKEHLTVYWVLGGYCGRVHDSKILSLSASMENIFAFADR